MSVLMHCIDLLSELWPCRPSSSAMSVTFTSWRSRLKGKPWRRSSRWRKTGREWPGYFYDTHSLSDHQQYIYLSHILAFIFLCVWYLIQAQIEIQESLAGAQKETLEGLQEATTKMMSQQAEAARYTADTARHIKEVSNHSLPLCLENSLCLHFITKADWLLSFSKDITINAEEESIISSVKLIKSYI